MKLQFKFSLDSVQHIASAQVGKAMAFASFGDGLSSESADLAEVN